LLERNSIAGVSSSTDLRVAAIASAKCCAVSASALGVVALSRRVVLKLHHNYIDQGVSLIFFEFDELGALMSSSA